MNHYATKMFYDEGGRHYWFAKYLKKYDYEPVIFSCNVNHFDQSKQLYFDDKGLWHEHVSPDGFPFVVIRSTPYKGNGFSRIRNMAVFARNLIRVAKKYEKQHGAPDAILASSVHPLTVLAGQHIAKKMNVPCICEVRDLWPESIFAYYPEKKKKFLAKILYAGEKRMYKKADAVVMTWAGGADYIEEQGWGQDVPAEKLFYIPNGVDLETFDENVSKYHFDDSDLSDNEIYKVVYTGALRRVNQVELLVEAAQILRDHEQGRRIRILIWGDGDYVQEMKEKLKMYGLENIIYKGYVNKKYIPSILSQADCCVLQYRSTILDRFGQSQNKFYEYLAASKPLLMTYKVGYSVCERYGCGIELEEQTAESIAEALITFAAMGADEQQEMGLMARKAAEEYDFDQLSKQLVQILEFLERGK